MPRLDRTGPEGEGPKTGLGRGNCGRGEQQDAGAPARGRGFGGRRGWGHGWRRPWQNLAGRVRRQKNTESE